jgi:hypothetical protein
MANKMQLQLKGFDELMSRLDAAGGDMKRATEAALKSSKQAITPEIEAAIAKHRRTGRTEESIDKSMAVEWDGLTASIDIGFHIRDGGLASIFLMYGTPRIQPDKQLYDAVYGQKVKRKIAKIQEEAINKVIERTMNGK